MCGAALGQPLHVLDTRIAHSKHGSNCPDSSCLRVEGLRFSAYKLKGLRFRV